MTFSMTVSSKSSKNRQDFDYMQTLLADTQTIKEEEEDELRDMYLEQQNQTTISR